MTTVDRESITTGQVARIDSADDARATADRLAAEFAVGAAARDRDRRLPHDEIEHLSRSGLLAITVPAAYGGPDLAPSVVADMTRRLAAADPNIAQIPHSHFVYLNLLRLNGNHDLASRQFGAVLAGGRIANAQSERGGKTIADIATRLVAADGRLALTGEKFYATGSLYAHTLAVLARLDEPFGDLVAGEYVAFVPADAPGVTIIDDWNGMGQRTTGSGTVRFADVVVDPIDLVERAPAVSTPTGYGAFAQLLHVAIDVGIARGALESAADFVRTTSRPWFEAGVERAVDDPLVVQRFGELAVEVSSAEALLAAAGAAVDQSTVGPGAADRDGLVAASIAVATAKVIADRVATSVTSALFEVSGTRSAAADLGLDHFWRNARTHTLHDPVRWKYQHIGRHVLRGEDPPIHGLL